MSDPFGTAMRNGLAGLSFVQQGIEQGTERKKQNALGQLASQGYQQGITPDLLAQTAAIDPRMAAGMEQQGAQMDEARLKKAGMFAGLLLKAPPQMRAQIWEAQVKPGLNAAGLPVDGPYSDEYEGIAQQLVQATGGGAPAPKWQNLGNGYVMDGQGNIKQAYDQPQKSRARPINVPDGKGGSVMMMFDPDTQQVSPMNFGGDQPQASTPAPGTKTYEPSIDLDTLPPGERQAAEMAMRGQDAIVVNGQAQAGSTLQQPQTASAGGYAGLGYKPPPQGRPPAGARPAPAGYRWKPDGTQEVIPGGPADRSSRTSGARGVKDPTEDQSKAAAWYAQANNAFANMRKVYEQDPSAAEPGIIEAYSPVDEVANRSRSSNRQLYAQAGSSLAEALLRAATGAGVTREEAIQKVRELTPQRGDGPEVIKQKFAAIPVYIESLRNRAGRAVPGAMPTDADADSKAPILDGSTADPLGLFK